jgi:site-specific DNA-methyltransferase (adenine-specific)
MIDLLKGDCIEIMKTIPNESIDAIITDPPYGTTACKWDSVIDFNLMWEQLHRITKPNGAIVLFGSEPFSSALRMSNINNYKYDWVWDKKQKVGMLNCKRMPLRKHENILVFNAKNVYYPIMEKGRFRNKKIQRNKDFETYGQLKNPIDNFNDDYYPSSILEFSNANQKGKQHPTQKPVALMEYLIKTYTNENETVLDFTMGSGSTGVACKNTNRKFIGIEQDEKYFKIAEQRINSTLF